MVTIFGSIAVTIMFLAYWAEDHSKVVSPGFCRRHGSHGCLQCADKAYPVAVIEALWTLIAIQRFFKTHRAEAVLA